jgi:hypothetical protein
MTAFYNANPKIFDTLEALGVSDDCVTLRGVAENKVLFNKYIGLGKDKTNPENDMKKFGNVKDALDYAANGKVVVYFADINLYAVFAGNQDCKELRTMLSNIVQNAREARQKKRKSERKKKRRAEFANDSTSSNSVDDDNSEDIKEDANHDPTFNIKQIVLSDHKQRMVFVSSNGSLEMIREYVKTFLKSDITTVDSPEGVEITVLNRTFDNLDAVRKELNKLCSKIEEERPGVLRGVRPLYQRSVHPFDYVDPRWNTADSVYEGDKIRDMLKSDWFAEVPGTVNIINNYNYNCTGVSTGMQIKNNSSPGAAKPLSSDQITAIAWINANPPGKREATKVYHNRYTPTSGIKLPIEQFSPLVKMQGHTKTHYKNVRVWK